MKNIFRLLILAAVFTGCIKDEYTDVTKEAMNAVRFSAASVAGSFPTQLYVPDLSIEEEFISLDGSRAKYEGNTTAPEDIQLEYKINPQALTKYNADNLAKDPSFKTFELMPDSTFSINVLSDVIKKGEVYAGNDSFNIVFYPQKINTTINYILPVTVTSSKYPTAPGTGTILYYLIGNPISGGYTWDFSRWNATDSTGPKHSLSFTGETAILVPVDATTVKVASGYFTQPRYVITFTDNGGVLSDFEVKFDADDLQYMKDNGVEVANGPNILIADPVAKRFRFQYLTNNGRYIIDDYYK